MATLSSFKSGIITAVGGGGGGGSGVTTYDSVNVLPLSGNTAGDQAFVTATDRLYIWDGSGWYNIALINTNPSFDSNGSPDSTYSLDSAGSSVSITLAATDPEGIPITYTTVKDDSADDFVSILQTTTTNTGDTFVISAKSLDSIISNGYDSNFVGTFDITFRASDGVNLATALSEFTVTFVTSIENSKYTTLLLKSVGANNGTNSSFTDASTNSHTITANGDVHAGTFSPYAPGGYSYYFDGTDDHLSITDSSLELSGEFTVSFWLYLNSLKDFNALFHWSDFSGNGSGYDNDIYIDSSGQVYSRIRNTNAQASSNTISAGQWYYLTVTRNSSNVIKVWVDESEEISYTAAGTLDNYISIGYNPFQGGRNYLEGYIRDFKITDASVSSPTIPSDPVASDSNTKLLTCHLPYLVDGSSNDHTITLNGNTKPTRFAPYDHEEYSSSVNGGSVYFDGNGDYLTVNGDSSLAFGTGDFTVECWVYLTSNSVTLYDARAASTNGDYLRISTSSQWEVYVDSSNRITSTTNYSLNQWHHVAYTRTGGTGTLYVDGTSVGTWADTTEYLNGSSRPLINASGFSSSAGGSCYISDARVVKGTAVYTSAFTPPTEPLTAITNTSLLINGTDGSIIDYSGSSNVAVTASDDVVSSTAVTKYGSSSIEFDGTGYATVNVEPFETGDFTVEFWCYASAYSSYQIAYDNRVGSATGIAVYLGTSGQLQLANNSNIVVSSAGSLPTDQWNHVAVTRESGTIYFYVNGTKSGNTYSDTRDHNGTEAVIGGNSADQNFTGYMEDIRVTKGLARYTANFTPPTSGLRG